MLRAAALLLSLLPAGALAWPVDVVFDTEAGKEKFTRVAEIDWVEVENPAIATVEAVTYAMPRP